MDAKARNLLSGATWIYGSQLATFLAQMVYAAITSRLANQFDFGGYAIALSVVGLANLIASGGFAQTVARETHLTTLRVRGLISSATILGLLVAAGLFASAGAWAGLWSAPESITAIQFASISTAVAPLLALSSGVLRRINRFKVVGLATLFCNIAGMGVGALVVFARPSPEALLVSPLFAQTSLLVSLAWAARPYFGCPRFPAAFWSDAKYGSSIVAATLFGYANGNVLRILGSRLLGPGFIGQLNRAEVLSILPLQQLQNALQQTLGPEFRHDRSPGRRAHRVWTDMMALAAYVVSLAAALAIAVLPTLVILLFGDQWRAAAELIPLLILAGAIQLIAVILSSAVEIIGKFKLLYAAQILGGLGTAVAVYFLLASRSGHWVILGAVLTQAIMHATQVAALSRMGYINGRRLLSHYAGATILSLVAYALAELFILAARSTSIILGIIALATTIAILLGLWLGRSRVAVYRLLSEYGLLPSTRPAHLRSPASLPAQWARIPRRHDHEKPE